MLKIFAGRSNEPLAKEIARYVEDRLSGKAPVDNMLGALDKRRKFSDGEIYVRFGENIRGCDVFIVQATNQPQENIQELEMMVDAARGASAGRVTAVIPYFGYARQDRKDRSRANVTAITQVKKLKILGLDRLIILDAHSSAVENAAWALDIKCDHLWARPAILRHLREREDFARFMEEGFVIGAPDLNAGKYARGYAKALGANVPIVFVEKRRDSSTGNTEILNVIGDPRNKNVFIVDDMIDSGGTLGDAARAFKSRGARRVCALAVHGVFGGVSGKISGRLTKSPIEKIFVTDSIYRKKYPPKVEVVSVADILGEAIWRTNANQSVSSLFDEEA